MNTGDILQTFSRMPGLPVGDRMGDQRPAIYNPGTRANISSSLNNRNFGQQDPLNMATDKDSYYNIITFQHAPSTHDNPLEKGTPLWVKELLSNDVERTQSVDLRKFGFPASVMDTAPRDVYTVYDINMSYVEEQSKDATKDHNAVYTKAGYRYIGTLTGDLKETNDPNSPPGKKVYIGTYMMYGDVTAIRDIFQGCVVRGAKIGFMLAKCNVSQIDIDNVPCMLNEGPRASKKPKMQNAGEKKNVFQLVPIAYVDIHDAKLWKNGYDKILVQIGTALDTTENASTAIGESASIYTKLYCKPNRYTRTIRAWGELLSPLSCNALLEDV